MAGHLAVINAGGWGTALAVLLGNAGYPVRLWCRRAELAADIEAAGENRTYLPGVAVPPPVLPTVSMEDALVGAEAVVLAPISRAARETARQVALHLRPGTPVVHASKGLELPTLLRLTQVVGAELGSPEVAALSGPDARGRGGPRHANRGGRGMH